MALQDSDAYREAAEAAGLRYVTPDEPGYRRKRWGRGFTYLTPDGEHLDDPEERARLEALAVPPAYREVWYCLDPDGHLQAVGLDDAGRRQYAYHPEWEAVRERLKFDHLLHFGEVLPLLRRRVRRLLDGSGLSRERVLAAVTTLLDQTHIRIGNREYAEQNGAYGLVTLRAEHAERRGEALDFAFTGKSGRPWELSFRDPRVAEVVGACEAAGGEELFCYHRADGVLCDVSAADVNEFLKELTDDTVSAKDFRTWAGTVLAALALAALDGEPRERRVRSALEPVAEALGNTVAVCRASYVHPEVVAGYLEGALPAALADPQVAAHPFALWDLSKAETLLLDFLQTRDAARGAEAVA